MSKRGDSRTDALNRLYLPHPHERLTLLVQSLVDRIVYLERTVARLESLPPCVYGEDDDCPGA